MNNIFHKNIENCWLTFRCGCVLFVSFFFSLARLDVCCCSPWLPAFAASALFRCCCCCSSHSSSIVIVIMPRSKSYKFSITYFFDSFPNKHHHIHIHYERIGYSSTQLIPPFNRDFPAQIRAAASEWTNERTNYLMYMEKNNKPNASVSLEGHENEQLFGYYMQKWTERKHTSHTLTFRISQWAKISLQYNNRFKRIGTNDKKNERKRKYQKCEWWRKKNGTE